MEGLASVQTFLQPNYLNADEQGVGVFGMKVNVFCMSDVGSGEKTIGMFPWTAAPEAQVPLISSAWQLLLAGAHLI